MIATRVDQGFRRVYRLQKTDDFSSVFAFRRALRGRFHTVHYRPNALNTARMGVTVAKKLVKRASGRNLVKRIARETFRRLRADLPPHDLIVRLHAPITAARRSELTLDLQQILARLPTMPDSATSPI